MLDDLSHDMEHTDSRLTSLINRVDKISKKAGGEWVGKGNKREWRGGQEGVARGTRGSGEGGKREW